MNPQVYLMGSNPTHEYFNSWQWLHNDVLHDASKKWQCVNDVVNMKNTTHVQRVTTTYVLSVLIQFILVLMLQGLVSQ